MYRGFKTYRHFINAKLHALSAIICGDDTVLDENLSLAGLKSVTELDLEDARKLYFRFAELAKQSAQKTDEMKSAIGLGKMNINQRKLIIRITKYKFRWSPQATFSFIAETFPDHRKRLSLWEIENSKLGKLYSLLSAKDADHLIKRLIQIEKRNDVSTSKGQSEN